MVRAEELAGQSARQALMLVRRALKEAGCPEDAFDAGQLYTLATGRDGRLDESLLSRQEAEKLAELAARRCRREPLQYLAGKWGFLDLELEVGPGVLVPRADTEVVCEAAAACIQGREAPRVLDLCSGSGCLALGVRRLVPGARVTALEKSPEAWPYLTANIAAQAKNGLNGVEAVKGDAFEYQSRLEPEGLELIVSNPPYLTGTEMDELQPEVRQEPAMALFGGEDGLDFYRHIAKAYRFALAPGGWLVFETGWQQTEAVARLLAQEGYTEISRKKDYGGNWRAVLGRRPLEG